MKGLKIQNKIKLINSKKIKVIQMKKSYLIYKG